MVGPRVYAQMARDGVFPSFFAVPGDREGSYPPLASIVLQGLLASLLVMFSSLASLLSYLGLVLSMSAAGAVACLFVLRRREGPAVVAGIGYPWVPASFVVATLVLALLSAVERPQEWLAAIATLVSGLVAYRVLRR